MDAGSILGLPTNLCSRPDVEAMGSVQCLIFRSCRRDRSSSNCLNSWKKFNN